MVTRKVSQRVNHKARKIKLLLTDCDGVLTDAGVYYSAQGEEMKRFSVRDGMGVERLRALANVDVGIITGEVSEALKRRAEKLKIWNLFQGIQQKAIVFKELLQRSELKASEVAYIGDDVNDIQIMRLVGLSACPVDAQEEVKRIADYKCIHRGGHGAFREFADIIILAKHQYNPNNPSEQEEIACLEK